jgi:hypothetical protein
MNYKCKEDGVMKCGRFGIFRGLVVCLAALLVIVGCSSGDGEVKKDVTPQKKVEKKKPGMTATAYNDWLVNQIDAVAECSSRLNRALQKKNHALVREELENYKEQITQSADNVSQMEGFRGEEEFRDAALDYLEFHENLANNEFDRLISMLIQELDGTYEMDDDEWKDWEADMKSLEEQEKEQDDLLNTIQKAFAKKHNLMLIRQNRRF